MNTDDLIRHYQTLLKQHGAGPKAVQFADAESHNARFNIIREVADPLDSVLDVGCGLADFYHFLKKSGFGGRYHGVDIVPEFIEIATESLADDPDATVSLMDAQSALPEGYDFAVLSGVFNNTMDDNKGFMETTLRRMYAAAQKGIAFNAMSTYVDYFDDDLYYCDPMQVFDFCKRELGGHVVLRHDYVLRDGGYPFEFAVYVYKQAEIAGE